MQMIKRRLLVALVVVGFAAGPAWSFEPVEFIDGLSRGHSILLDRGLQIQALSWPGIAGSFDFNRWEESNFTTVHIWGGYSLADVMPGPMGVPWSGWTNGSGVFDHPVVDYPYASDAVAFQFRDEQDITDVNELATLEAEVAAFRETYTPLTILNVLGGQSN